MRSDGDKIDPKEIPIINRARKEVGLPPLKLEKTTCLKCGVEFKTYDKRVNRRCESCIAKENLQENSNDFFDIEYL